jgi:hypothetical protein
MSGPLGMLATSRCERTPRTIDPNPASPHSALPVEFHRHQATSQQALEGLCRILGFRHRPCRFHCAGGFHRVDILARELASSSPILQRGLSIPSPIRSRRLYSEELVCLRQVSSMSDSLGRLAVEKRRIGCCLLGAFDQWCWRAHRVRLLLGPVRTAEPQV